MTQEPLDAAKQAIRQRVWSSLDTAGAVHPPGAQGHIPNFIGADLAAARLAELPQWRDARVVKANPDKAQHPVRALALGAGKLVYMAVPRLAGQQPFYLLDPTLPTPPERAADSAVAADLATTVDTDTMRPVDLVMCGSVAVNHQGVRLGKGAGYSDIEVALLWQAGLVGPRTVFATTVHDLQVLDEHLPDTEHDFRLDLIITPTRVITCPNDRRATGLVWEHLTEAKIAAIPALQRAQALR